MRIPGVARSDAGAPADQPTGYLPNSDADRDSVSLGASWFGSSGYFGAAVSRYSTDYGIPTDEPISISMRQKRLDLAGELTQGGGIFHGLKGRFGVGDYTHSEIAGHVTVNTRFRNKAWEGRLELPHSFAPNVSGTFGAQASRSDFSAVGEEVVFPAALTTVQAVFAKEEWKIGAVALQIGGRLERQTIQLGEVDPGLPTIPGYGAHSGERRSDWAESASAGLVYYHAKDWSAGLSLAVSERLPTAQELFSNGPHGGTGAWEIGRENLSREKSIGLELSLKKRAGFVTGSVGTFVNRFRGYIFEQELPLETVPEEINEEGLTPYQFAAKNALFYGGEAEAVVHLVEQSTYSIHLQLTADYVRAEQTTDDEPLPRIPPLRFGSALRFDTRRFHLGIEMRAVARQTRVAPSETETPGHALLNADASYVLPVESSSIEVFVRGTNLGNREARVHTSFLKDFAPLPGRGVAAGVRMTF
jgi:iron complex outermembrane receptor protein